MKLRLPDWLIYFSAAGVILLAARMSHEAAEAPEPPPPVPGAEALPLPASLPFDRSLVVRVPKGAHIVGTAFSVAADGLWLTAADTARTCRRPVLVIAPGRGVEAGFVLLDEGGVAVLRTAGGAPPIPIAVRKRLLAGERAFFPGFPRNQSGEVAGRLIGPIRQAAPGRDGQDRPALSWAESGRTEGLGTSLRGMAGAPVIGEDGRAVGLLLEDSSRRGTLLSTSAQALALAVAKARTTPQTAPRPDPVTLDNYFRVADALRRELSVVQVVCRR